jgi:hypothetical protein
MRPPRMSPPQSRNLIPATPSVAELPIAERCSVARVRYAAPNSGAPLPPPRRSAGPYFATDGSAGHQDAKQFLRLAEDENQVIDRTS